MRVYDFDKTVFYPDSSFCFIRFALRRMPLRVLPCLLKALPFYVKRLCGNRDAKALKEQLFSFLKYADADLLVRQFWNENLCRMEPWYLQQHREDDLIISASPEFLLKPVAEQIGFRMIGTRMDNKTGKITGANCYGREKPIRMAAEYPDAAVEEFYSDSLSDTPLALLAQKAYLVERGKLSAWPK